MKDAARRDRCHDLQIPGADKSLNAKGRRHVPAMHCRGWRLRLIIARLMKAGADLRLAAASGVKKKSKRVGALLDG